MTKAINVSRRAQLFIVGALAIIFLSISTPHAAAQDGKCQVGARVQVEMIDNAVGTITEVGTEPPHVGWYRVVYDWNVRSGNPKGEWYNPQNREIRINGTGTKCGTADAEEKPQPQARTNTTPPGQDAAAAQDGKCQVGARVQVEEISNAVGTITEVGTEPPHVGWYRVVYDWNVRSGNPKGEWYNPQNREIRIDGTDTKCGPTGAETKPQPQNKRNNTTPGAIADGKTPGRDECPMNEPPGTVSKTAPASAQLFKRVIYETMAFAGKSTVGSKKMGLTFLESEMGKAYRNTLTGDRFGDKRLHDGAPVGAMIHPVKTKYLRCELYDTYIRGYVRQHNFVCFKDRHGDWVCEYDGVLKTLEERTIPLK